MKLNIYLIIFFSSLFFSCKTEEKKPANIEKKIKAVEIPIQITQESIVSKKASKDLKKKITDSIKIQKQEIKSKSKNLKEKLTGKIYRDANEFQEFSGFSSGGFVIGESFTDDEFYKGKRYSINEISGIYDEILFLIFDELHKRDSDGQAYNKVVDILEMKKETDVFQKYPDEEIIIISDVLVNNNRDPELIALVAYEEASVFTKVYKVWRANRETGKFEEITDLSNITVFNEDY